MLRRVSVLALALALAACGDDSDDPIPPERMAIEILRGDNFRDTVYLGGPARAMGAVVYEPVAVGELEVSPEPLVAKFGERLIQPSSSLTGPSFATLPPNTTADWVVVDHEGNEILDGRCGRPVNTTTIPASDGTTTNYWQRPRKAGTCYMRLQGVVNGVPYVDTVFTRVFLAGPPVVPAGWITFGGGRVCAPDLTLDGMEMRVHGFIDANGNPTEQYRVEGVGTWIETVSTEFGTFESRHVRVVGTPALGDTATVRVYDALGNLVADMLATLIEGPCTDMRKTPPVSYNVPGLRLEARPLM